MTRKHTRKHNSSNKSKGKGQNNQILLYKQLNEVDTLIVDHRINPTDSADVGYDLFTVLNASLDYAQNQVTYGQMHWTSVEFRFVPYFPTSTVSTDHASGAFGMRQGVYDTTVTVKAISGVIREPGSKLINNKTAFLDSSPIMMRSFISTTDTNTLQSEVPKFNFYFAWSVPSTTNSSLGSLHVRAVIKYRSKTE